MCVCVCVCSYSLGRLSSPTSSTSSLGARPWTVHPLMVTLSMMWAALPRAAGVVDMCVAWRWLLTALLFASLRKDHSNPSIPHSEHGLPHSPIVHTILYAHPRRK